MKLIAVTNDRIPNEQLIGTLLEIEQVIDAVILREKSKTDAEVIDLIQTLKASGFDSAKIIVHGRADIAAMTGIEKVQLPGHGAPLPLAKQQFPSLSFGRSTHSFEEAEAAYTAGADWLLYGHLFATDSKEGLSPRGTEELFQIVESLSIPVYAIGGIQPKHLPALKQSGVAGVAVMSSIFGNDNPRKAADGYREVQNVAKG
ncbi:thiamine phosphate synthase [Sporosarcina sp. ACRSM]|uniref:thiamine phosphate synthase n=1 Tax=Sporosarcina sp. ACRSM TaxID=2918216 RepID=UPI001EF6AB74|nr:thiamine phosphate synthase [Sporosarcina sp. ACRSM]MCG7336681.1 thiamine phosphate synthase [Sporosarcina sp. ACRSM]